MLAGKAINASNAKVYINGYWIDDFVSMRYEHQNPKIPFRGYHQKYWTAVADGKVMVAGNMVLNFRYPGYLLKAISAVNGIDTQLRAKFNMSKARLMELIDRIRTSNPQERVAILAEAPPEAFDLMSELMQATIDGSSIPGVPSANPVELGPSDSWAGSNGFELDIVYGDENPFIERLVGVHMTSQARDITNSASQGAEPLYDAYSFFAKKIVVDLQKADILQKSLPDAIERISELA